MIHKSSDEEPKVGASASVRLKSWEDSDCVPLVKDEQYWATFRREHEANGNTPPKKLSNSGKINTSTRSISNMYNMSETGCITSLSVMTKSALSKNVSATCSSASSNSSDGKDSKKSYPLKSLNNETARNEDSRHDIPETSNGGSSHATTGTSSSADMLVRKKEEKRGGVKGKSLNTARKGKESVRRPRSQRQEDATNCRPANEGIRDNASERNYIYNDDIEVTVTGSSPPSNLEQFEDAHLNGVIMENIRRCGYTRPTLLQKHSLPIIQSGKDMLACTHKGSGKAAAFLIPTINSVIENDFSSLKLDSLATPQLLILTPTRESAIKIYIEAKELSDTLRLVTELCYGGTTYLNQFNKFERGCHILIGTPGRVLRFLMRGKLSLLRMRHLVIDGVDKMLDMNYMRDVETIMKHESIDNRFLQILMFSSTFPYGVRKLANVHLRNYICIAVGVVEAHFADVEQLFHLVFKYGKTVKLYELLNELNRAKTLIFVEKKRTADIVAAYLSEKGLPALSMHGGHGRKLREETLNTFRSRVVDVLVVTRVVAAGLDIRGINYVINYDMPKTLDEYIERVGHTGRTGNEGLVFSFYEPNTDLALAKGIAKLLTEIHQDIPEFIKESKKMHRRMVAKTRKTKKRAMDNGAGASSLYWDIET